MSSFLLLPLPNTFNVVQFCEKVRGVSRKDTSLSLRKFVPLSLPRVHGLRSNRDEARNQVATFVSEHHCIQTDKGIDI